MAANCRLVSQSGHSGNRLLRCPYHAWTYNLDGTLRGTPMMEHAEHLELHAQRLPALRVETWHGFVLVNADADALPVTTGLEALDNVLAPYSLTTWVPCCALEFDSPWNWKVLVENFMESYHHAATHPQTLNRRYPAQGTYMDRFGDRFSLLENPAKNDPSGGFWVWCIYPMGLFSLVRGPQPFCSWYEMQIEDHDHFRLTIRVYAPKQYAGDPDYGKRLSETIRTIHLEDVAICEEVWRGLCSPLARPGRLLHLEDCISMFQKYWRARMDG